MEQFKNKKEEKLETAYRREKISAKRCFDALGRKIAGNTTKEDREILDSQEFHNIFRKSGKKENSVAERWSGDAEKVVDGKSGGTWHDNYDNY